MFTEKKILILGLARSGYASAKLLLKRHNKVIVNDLKEEKYHSKEHIDELRKLGCELIFGYNDVSLIDESIDYLIKNPGVPINHPYVVKARELKIPVINEVELCYQLMPKDITIIGITGTNGKTTTTTLTYNILSAYFHERVHLAGNIGFPLSSVMDDLKPNDILVMEVSCQQSENIINFHPNIALITNYSEAHIDFFGNYEHYRKVKSKMFYNQTADDIAILNGDNKLVLEQMRGIKAKIKYFAKNKEVDCYIKDNYIYYQDDKVINLDDIKIPGMHNVENCMAAITIAKTLNVKNETIVDVISNFRGVNHRLEFVSEIDGVRYYNDTEATNIKCTQIALQSFDKPTILILGGLERGQDFNELKPFMQNVKKIIAIGECRNRVLTFGQSLGIDTYVFEHLKDAFPKIFTLATSGDVVLLSPASASWDQYRECEERGDLFKKYVIEKKEGNDYDKN